MSLRDTQAHLLIAFDDAVISEEQFVLLYYYNKSSNLDYHMINIISSTWTTWRMMNAWPSLEQ